MQNLIGHGLFLNAYYKISFSNRIIFIKIISIFLGFKKSTIINPQLSENFREISQRMKIHKAFFDEP